MTLLGGVATRLAFALLGVVVGALVIVYLIVVPSYRSSLAKTELSTLAAAVRAGSAAYAPEAEWPTAMVEQYSARAVVFSVVTAPLTVIPFADSNETTNDSSLVDDQVALKAARTLKPARAVVHRDGHSYAEAAYPLGSTGPVLMLSRSFDEQAAGVGVVRRRVFVAGAIVVGLTVLLGYLGASLFTRRIRRLEHAAERIAAGDFEQPVVDPGTDELAQLARAFERMRLRLARLDRARGAFIANASHELRTPLFSLGGFLELLDDPELDEPTREEFLSRMREQVERLTKLATDLLDLSRLDAGRIAVVAEDIDLSGLADELAAEFGPRASVTGHELQTDAAAPVAARGDAVRVLQIGRILVENALVHTPAGTSIELATGREGGRATLAVRDHGAGIPAEAQNHVFERFYRLDGARASGSGLGLAIAREVAEVMGGRIELASANGSTAFTLVLPAAMRETADFP